MASFPLPLCVRSQRTVKGLQCVIFQETLEITSGYMDKDMQELAWGWYFRYTDQQYFEGTLSSSLISQGVTTENGSTCLIWHRYYIICPSWCKRPSYPGLVPALGVHQHWCVVTFTEREAKIIKIQRKCYKTKQIAYNDKEVKTNWKDKKSYINNFTFKTAYGQYSP